MAALQTLRNKPALLMSVIGGALLLFIITLVFDNNSGIGGPDMEAGEAYGEEISIQDYDSKVAQEENFLEVFNMLQTGQPQNLTEENRVQIRQQVWNDFVSMNAVKNEANELGLSVSDEDVKNALTASNFPEVRFLMSIGAATTGNPTIDGYKQFMANFDKQLMQIRQQQPQMEEFFVKLYEASLYCEKKLQDVILKNKYSTLLRNSFIGNTVTAQMAVNESNYNYDAEIAVVPYTTIADSAVKVEDKDLKSKYEANKKLFYTSSATRHIKFIDVPVQASASDLAQIRKEVVAVENSLKEAKTAEEVATIISDSKSTISYNDVYFTKEAFGNDIIYNIAAVLDTMKVGAVQKTTNDGRFISTYKLVGKVNTADSLFLHGIGAKDKAQADSILTAIKAGSTLGDIAVALGQPDTTVWVANPIYIERPANSEENVYTNVCQLETKKAGIVVEQQNYMVMEVLAQKSMSTKYNVAFAKYPVEYSKDTYDNALSKLNNYLANNKTVKDFNDNAAKEGYMVNNIPNFSSDNSMAISRIQGEQAKVAVRWILDEAEEGDISNAFECPTDPRTAHIFAVAVVSASDDEYLPLKNEGVKEYITELVKLDKKAEMIQNDLKDVKSIADAQAKNAMTENLTGVVPAQMVRVSTTGTVEPILAGALEKSKAGDFVGTLKGGAGVYVMQVNSKNEAKNDINMDAVLFSLNQYKISNTFGMMQGAYGQQSVNIYPELLLAHLSQFNGNVADKRYKFDR